MEARNLMLMLAATTPEPVIFEMLEEAVTNHKLAPSVATKERLVAVCALVLSKEAINACPDGLGGVMERGDRMIKGGELLNPGKN